MGLRGSGPLFFPLRQGVEAAIQHTYNRLKENGKRSVKASFENQLKWLVAEGAIKESHAEEWEEIRKQRNPHSHPQYQGLITPGIAIKSLERIEEIINRLFSSQQIRNDQNLAKDNCS